ncbi:MAG: hypothetical protein ABR987_06295 [Terracidiphilus sp.]
MRARNVAWLLPFLLTGCFHFGKTQIQQDQVLAPIANLPKPPLVHPDLPDEALVIPDQPLATDADMEQEPVPAARHRRPVKPVQQAANTPPEPAETPGVSAIGQLSSGEPMDLRLETSDWIADTERGLNGLRRRLSGPEQKTAGQIKEYLRQAREALISGDVDGAHTLAAKAKVLLSELNQ